MTDKYPKELFVRDPDHNQMILDGAGEETVIAFQHINDSVDKGCTGEVAIYELKKVVRVENESKIVEEK